MLAQAEKRGETAAARWNLPADASTNDLRKLSTDEILKAEPNYLRTNPDYKPISIIQSFPYVGVVVDGYVLPNRPADIFAAGQQHPAALILGSNFREWIPVPARQLIWGRLSMISSDL